MKDTIAVFFISGTLAEFSFIAAQYELIIIAANMIACLPMTSYKIDNPLTMPITAIYYVYT